MNTSEEYEEFGIGDQIRLTGGTYEGHNAEITGFVEHPQYGWLATVTVDNGIKVAVLVDWLEKDQKPVNILKHGMTSEDLAESVNMVVQFCMARVNGVGAEQYAGEDHQKFEAMSMEDLMEYQIEEIADDINYAVMRFIRLRRIQAAMRNHL